MSDPFTAIVGAALTATKLAGDAAKEKSQKTVAATTQRYSPWTGMQAGKIDYSDPGGTLSKGAGSILSTMKDAPASGQSGNFDALSKSGLVTPGGGTGGVGSAPLADPMPSASPMGAGGSGNNMFQTNLPIMSTPGVSMNSRQQMPSIGTWDALKRRSFS